MRSFLITDLGIAYTRTILIDVVEGQYRLIYGTRTRTTTAPPDNDVTLGLIRSIETIQDQTGRRLLSEQGLVRPAQADGSGFDEFMATASSAGRSLRAVVVGLMDDFSLVSAQRALTGTYVEVIATISLADDQTEEERVNKILQDRPDVIFIVGGTNNGNQETVRGLIRLVEVAVKLLPSHLRPIVMYAGNERLIPWLKTRLDQHCVVFTADNVRPDAESENLHSAKLKLAQVFNHFLSRQPGGFGDVAELSSSGLVPTAQSAARLVRYLDSLDEERGGLYIDVGSGSSSLLSSYKGFATADIRSILGIGHGAAEVIHAIDWRDVERWLPFPFSREALENWGLNKSLNPLTIPADVRELFIEMGVVREIIRLMHAEAAQTWRAAGHKSPVFSPVIVGGGFLNITLPPRLTALLIMDALEPRGIQDIWLDPYALAPALGTVSFVEPLAVVQVIDNGGFGRLGTAFCPSGRLRGARMKVKITLADGEVIEKRLSAGDIWLPDLAPGSWVDVEIQLSRGLKIEGKRRITRRILVGSAGLIFDLRGRPLELPSGRRRRRVIADWFMAAAGIELSDEQLRALEAAAVEGQTEDLGSIVGSLVGGISETDFPHYGKLPNKPLDPTFQALLSGEELEMPDFDIEVGEAAEEMITDQDKLRKELGL